MKNDIYRKLLYSVLVTETQYIIVPKSKILSGEKAIKALHEYISKLNGEKSAELTERHKVTLMKIAKGLISSLEGEKRIHESEKSQFLIQLGKVRQLFRETKQKNAKEEIMPMDVFLRSQTLMSQQIR